MSAQSGVGLPEALERAASALGELADAIRPANGDPVQLIEQLPAEAAVQVLRWLLENEPADGAELVQEWLEVPERGAAVVLGVAEDGLAKPARKVLRRAHHQLRSRGVAVPEAAPAPTLATLPRVEEAFEEAVVSPLDPRGGRVGYLATAHPQGGLRLFEIVFDTGRGVQDCSVYSMGRSKARRFFRELEKQPGLAAVAVPADALRALVARAAEAQPEDRPLPRGFREWLPQIGRPTQGARTPGALVREAVDHESEPSGVRRAAELVEQGEIGPWPPAPDALAGLAERLDAIATSTVIADAKQRREQLFAAIDDALPEIFDAAFAAATAERFEEAAYLLWRRDRLDDARGCLAAADAFREGGVGENAAARQMIERALAPLLAKAEAEEGTERDEEAT